jgi:hypothetical protein
MLTHNYCGNNQSITRFSGKILATDIHDKISVYSVNFSAKHIEILSHSMVNSDLKMRILFVPIADIQ